MPLTLAGSLALSMLLAAAQAPVLAPGKGLAIGPKQDDPLRACSPESGTGSEGTPGGAPVGIIVQGGLAPETDPRAAGGPTGIVAIGPKQDDPRVGNAGSLAIGPKQDDPLVADTGAAVSIGPKQDDPRRASAGILAIGPKQDDPRSPALVGRPSDDEDPKAQPGRCKPQS